MLKILVMLHKRFCLENLFVVCIFNKKHSLSIKTFIDINPMKMVAVAGGVINCLQRWRRMFNKWTLIFRISLHWGHSLVFSPFTLSLLHRAHCHARRFRPSFFFHKTQALMLKALLWSVRINKTARHVLHPHSIAKETACTPSDELSFAE